MFRRIYSQLGRFVCEEDGPTAVEYAVMVSLIAAFCIVSIRSVSTATRASFDQSAQAIGGAMSP